MARTISRAEGRRISASVHAKRGEECVCGRTVYGNGRLSHFRACPDYLREKGWRFSGDEQVEILRAARETLDEDMTPEEQSAAIGEFMHAVAMREARNRGLLR